MSKKIFYVRKSVVVNKWFIIEDFEDYFPDNKNYMEFFGETDFTGQLLHVSDIDKFTDTPAESVEFKCVDGAYYARVTSADYKCVICENCDGTIISVRVDAALDLSWFYDKFYKREVEQARMVVRDRVISVEELQTFINVLCLAKVN